jgi:hypothetical protein
VFYSRKSTTLTFCRPDNATISPKSRSNVRTTRFSATALQKIWSSERRWSSSSRRCPCIVTLIAEPLDQAYRHAQVGKKPHSLPYDEFLLDKPGHVFKRLLDVTGFQIGIICKNFLLCRTVLAPCAI